MDGVFIGDLSTSKNEIYRKRAMKESRQQNNR